MTNAVNTYSIDMDELVQQVILSKKEISPFMTEESPSWFKTTETKYTPYAFSEEAIIDNKNLYSLSIYFFPVVLFLNSFLLSLLKSAITSGLAEGIYYFTIPFSRYSTRFILRTSEAALSAATLAMSWRTISSTSCSKVVV